MTEFIHRNGAGHVLAEKSEPVEHVPVYHDRVPRPMYTIDVEQLGVHYGRGDLLPLVRYATWFI